jgi:hypothetical protein
LKEHPLRGRNVLFIAVLMLAAPSTAVIRSLTSNEAIDAYADGTGRVMSRLGGSEKHVQPAQTERLDRMVQSEPRLILQQSASGAVDDVIPLGAQVDDGAVAVTLEIRALPVGMTISSGRRLGAVWRIRAADAVSATIHPPTGFSGAVDLTVELRRSDDTIVDRGSVHREWLERPIVAATMIEPVRGVTFSDITANNVMATSTPTDQTAQSTDKSADLAPGSVMGAPIETGRAGIVWNVQPEADKGHTATATASAKRKRGAVRSRIHAQAAHEDRYQVYGAGRLVGADPDLDIRTTLARQYAWLN